ncbi:hypothetical protein I5M27_13100 [Adhaeribacter sp. BT258]|uniref:Uncharacterized protein n=1 Tax=Adhaeribacter terrigena TaxID=2793070 RepID=A0ABS1C428_9BACT|nr:hypothetical protein [Adhaeribacter terrigena]MBK0403926.1 hypothetical protein [Adhaeribacter terrigena]
MDIKKWFKGKYLFFTIPTIIWVGGVIVLSIFKIDIGNTESRINKKNCEDEKKLKAERIQGVVTSKFADERGVKFFKYVSGSDTLISQWALLNPKTYNFLQVGDSILKENGSLEFKINRTALNTTFIYYIDWDCNEALLK